MEYDAIDGTKTISGAYHLIDGQNGVIESKVSKGDVASTINQTAQSVLISAEKIDLEGYVTVDNLAASIADIGLTIGDTVVTEYLTITSKATLAALALDGQNVSKTTLPIVTSFTQASGETAAIQNVTFLHTAIAAAVAHAPLAGTTKTF